MAKQETAVELVTMTDERKVEFPGKRKLDKTSLTGPNGEVQVRLDFRNGETRLYTVPAELLGKFAAHGAEQKLGDEIAGVDDIDDCVLAVDELIARLQKGEWTMTREANAFAGASTLLKAIVEVTKKDVDKVREWLRTKSPAEKLALRESPKFAEAVKAIEADKAAKRQKIDTAPLMGEIDAIA
jgi:hypothetical protein